MNRKKSGKIWIISKNDLSLFAKESLSFADILRKIGFGSWSSIHYQSLKSRLEVEKIDYSHIGNGMTGKRTSSKLLSKEEAIKKVFINNSPYHQRTVRDYARRYGFLNEKCECNQGVIWQNKPLTLQLDHINGQNKDNRIDNLRWLCPNCHSQTETFGVKKIKFMGHSSNS